jgi:predicted transcriptional regulator
MKLTKFELEIMNVVWNIGMASVREIQEKLPEQRRPAYTTVQTILNRLEEKGAVRRVKKIGNAFVFEAAVTRGAAHRRLIDDFLELFGGSVQPVMARLVETGKLTLKDVQELEQALEQAESGEDSALYGKSNASKLEKKRSGKK